MSRMLLLVLAALSIAAQQEPPRHDKYASDKDAYCWNPKTSGTLGPRRERDPHAHKCECHLLCVLGAHGEIVGDQEDQGCELWCTRSLCDCHRGEEACEKPSTK